MGSLTVKAIEGRLSEGRHFDGAGLYLQVRATGSRSWLYRWKDGGKVKVMGLGAYPAVGLADAREKARECARMRAKGIDPLEQKRASKQAKSPAPAAPAGKTFSEVAAEYIKSHQAGWKSAKTLYIWRHSLEHYADKAFGAVAVDKIDRPMILSLLRPIWNEKPETAGRVRRHVEAVLNFARAHDYRSGDNPAVWRGNLQFAFVDQSKIRTVKHHPALPYAELPAFLRALRERPGVGALAFEFAILTACRTSEVLGATWQEVDIDAKLWSIPGSRMKAGKPHTVPLSARAIDLLKAVADFRRGAEPWLWPGDRIGRPLSNMAFLMLLRRMDRSDLTAHGFRSTFRDWISETTEFSSEVAEMALAHVVSNKVEAAYRRGDLLAKRRELMEAWAAFCCGAAPAEVNHKEPS